MGLILSIVLVLSGILLWRFQRSFQEFKRADSATIADELVAQIENRGKAIARLLAENLVNPLYYNDMWAMGHLLETVRSQSDVKFVRVFDEKGKILHDGTPAVQSFGQSAGPDLPYSDPGFIHKEHSIRKERVLEILCPVRLDKQVLGGVLLGLSMDGIQQEIKEMEGRLGAIEEAGYQKAVFYVSLATLGLFVAGILLSIPLAARLTRPILEVTRYAEKLGQGSYDFEIKSR